MFETRTLRFTPIYGSVGEENSTAYALEYNKLLGEGDGHNTVYRQAWNVTTRRNIGIQNPAYTALRKGPKLNPYEAGVVYDEVLVVVREAVYEVGVV